MITISRFKKPQGQKLPESREKGEWKGLWHYVKRSALSIVSNSFKRSRWNELPLPHIWWKWVECEKDGLKLNIQKTKIKASGPITSWEIDGETAETVSDFIWGGGAPKSLQMVTAAMKLKDAYSLEGKLWPT